MPDYEMAEELIKINGIASIPIWIFLSNIDEKNLRFCFAKKEETLKKGRRYIDKNIIIHNLILRFDFLLNLALFSFTFYCHEKINSILLFFIIQQSINLKI